MGSRRKPSRVWGILLCLCSLPTPATAITTAEAARFLTQASFGPTEAAIGALADRGYEGWIEDQMNLGASLHRPSVELQQLADGGDDQSLRQEMWWRMAIRADDQLRQRMAFALSEILVVSSDHSQLFNRPVMLAEYYDILVRQAFGNYRDLLEEVTRSPAMGLYLSMLRNSKPDPRTGRRPDENFAREIMQLFSIGLHQLHSDGSTKLDAGGNSIPTYDQKTIENFARAFTGWAWADGEKFTDRGSSYAPMKPYDDHHDMGAKTLLNGVQLPAGQGAEQDLEDALDNIFSHPNVAPFIARRLIQRFTTSNPSPGYLRRVAAVFDNNGRGVRGDLGAVLRAILLDAEARQPPTTGFGKLREPLLRLTAIWRAFNAAAADGRYHYPRPERDWGQAALHAESVFNFFRPDFRADGGQSPVAPEFQIQTESQSIIMINAMSREIRGRGRCNSLPDTENPGTVYLDLCGVAALAARPDQMAEHLNQLLLYGRMSERMRAALLSFNEKTPLGDGVARARGTIFLIATSAEFVVQK